MRRFLYLFLFIFIMCAMAVPVNAQTDITIDEMQVKIWPEYDQPSVLVINNIFLSGDTKFPATVNFNIPAAAGAPNSVAVRELDGQLYLLDYQTTTNGDWIELTFTTPYAELWIEYYDPSLVINDSLRSYAYSWIGDYPVNNFSLEVQQPVTASNMTFKESMGQALLGNDGLTYFTNNVGSLKANTKISLNLEYTKTDNTLSSSASIPVQPVTPLNDGSSQGTSLTELLPYIVAGIGLVIIVVGVLWYLNRQKEVIPQSRQRHTTNQRRVSSLSDDAIFCHRCGRKAGQGDVFCRACGTKLKIDE